MFLADNFLKNCIFGKTSACSFLFAGFTVSFFSLGNGKDHQQFVDAVVLISAPDWPERFKNFQSLAYVSVNFNWVHPPPGNPGENYFERANPSYLGKFFV